MIEVYITVGNRIKVRQLSARGVHDPYFYMYASMIIEECIREDLRWSVCTIMATEAEQIMWQHAEAMILTDHFNRLRDLPWLKKPDF